MSCRCVCVVGANSGEGRAKGGEDECWAWRGFLLRASAHHDGIVSGFLDACTRGCPFYMKSSRCFAQRTSDYFVGSVVLLVCTSCVSFRGLRGFELSTQFNCDLRVSSLAQRASTTN